APDEMHWAIRLKADPDAPPLEGTIDYIGDIIDPNQHTALVIGRVDNLDRRLRAGQFITARIALPAPRNEVVIPVTCLVEQGADNFVFVQPDAGKEQYTLRRVVVARRLPGAVAVRSKLTAEQERKGLTPLEPGARVVSNGAVEMMAALEELRAKAKNNP